ncbi:MAG: hypothetical protein SFY81_05660 [Verrucomicrobiota bacterium]|nr:hypothetical protein [Verrucomicrobiota bacterium]
MSRTVTNANLTLNSSHHYVGVSVTTAVTITLPTAVGNSGKEYIIGSEASSANITIAPYSGQKINGVAANKSHTTGYSSIKLISNGTDGWFTY